MHPTVLDYLNEHGYNNVDDGLDGLYMAFVGSCCISIRYNAVSPPDMIRWAEVNEAELPDADHYHITRVVGMAYDETYFADDEVEAVALLEYLTNRSKSPTTNEAIEIHRSMNDMVNMLNEATGNTGRFQLPDII
jgi:hypothetical protein